MKTYAIHGFLGLPSDWKDYPLFSPINLWETEVTSYWQWARKFNLETVVNSRLIGYSLGGRLALHALIDNPSQWQSAVIISAHPGLSDGRQRIAEDEQWAQRFELAPWEELMALWNQNPVFADEQPPIRHERDYDRQKLAQALRVWSLGRQENLLNQINELPMPILWVVGENDLKFREISKWLKFSNPRSRIVVIPNSGHRVPWQQRAQFNLETAVQDDKVMQDFELELLSTGVEHSQMVKATPVGRDYSSKDCVNLSSSTAVSRFKTLIEEWNHVL